MYRWLFLPLLGFAAMTVHATANWITPAEAAHFRTTPSYADTLAYLRRLQGAAPGVIRLQTFGTTPEGRPMTVVIASGDGTFDPVAARAAHKPVVLVQAGIHPGEIEGKDAGLMLLRDIAVAHKFPHLLDGLVLVYIPVFSVDGHENSSPYHRINQNGPARMGFRGQSQYLNLNRDYIKADAPEMLAWLKLWQRWLPDLLIDVHTTDGADYQYDLTWYTEDPHKLDPAVSGWQHDAIVNLPGVQGRPRPAQGHREFRLRAPLLHRLRRAAEPPGVADRDAHAQVLRNPRARHLRSGRVDAGTGQPASGRAARRHRAGRCRHRGACP
jgi:hypothetical protein